MTRLLTLLLATAVALSGTAMAASVTTDDDGVPHVLNDAPAEGVQRLELVEQWRAGGEDDDIFFGVVMRAAKGADGNIYLLDSQLSQVYVYAPDGTYVGTLGREGEGPGEFQFPTNLAVFPDGRIGVSAGMTSKIVTLDAAGNPGPTIRPGNPAEGGFGAVRGLFTAGDHLLVCGVNMTMTDEGMSEDTYLATLDDKGDELTRYWSKSRQRDFTKPSFNEQQEYFADNAMAVDADGRVYVARERDRYAVYVYDADGVLLRVVERPDYQPRKRTAAEIEEVTSGMAIVVNGAPLEIENEVEDHDPAIARLFVDDAGLLWVADGHAERREGVFRRYDVFDAEGAWLRSVDVIVAGDQEMDGLMPLGDGRFLLITDLFAAVETLGGRHAPPPDVVDDDGTEDADPLEVICYGSL